MNRNLSIDTSKAARLQQQEDGAPQRRMPQQHMNSPSYIACATRDGPFRPTEKEIKGYKPPPGVPSSRGRPWPWNADWGCENNVHGISIAMAEQKGLLAKHFPRVVIEAGVTFKRKTLKNPHNIVCHRCRDGARRYMQEKHLEGMAKDFERRVAEGKPPARHGEFGMAFQTDANRAASILAGEVTSTKGSGRRERRHRD